MQQNYLNHAYLIVASLLSTVAHSQDSFRHVVSSSSQTRNDLEWRTSSQKTTPECKHQWWIHKTTLHGGRQQGVELIVVNNGIMEITLCPTRGMGIMSDRMGDVHLKWDSPELCQC